MADISTLTVKHPDTPSPEGYKSYTFRSIPAATHQAWKIAAASASMSMEEFGILAIQHLVQSVLKPEPQPTTDATDTDTE